MLCKVTAAVRHPFTLKESSTRILKQALHNAKVVVGSPVVPRPAVIDIPYSRRMLLSGVHPTTERPTRLPSPRAPVKDILQSMGRER
jgi:hypothetical protein